MAGPDAPDGRGVRPTPARGWLELFFDLVFVVVIARLAHHLAAHLDAGGVLEFVLQFLGVFWVWNAFIYYAERCDLCWSSAAGSRTRRC